MTNISLDQIKKLRHKTKAGVMDCRRALEESSGNVSKAEEWLRRKGIASASKRAGRETTEGLIEAYIHNEGKIVAVVELLCESPAKLFRLRPKEEGSEEMVLEPVLA